MFLYIAVNMMAEIFLKFVLLITVLSMPISVSENVVVNINKYLLKEKCMNKQSMNERTNQFEM